MAVVTVTVMAKVMAVVMATVMDEVTAKVMAAVIDAHDRAAPQAPSFRTRSRGMAVLSGQGALHFIVLINMRQ